MTPTKHHDGGLFTQSNMNIYKCGWVGTQKPHQQEREGGKGETVHNSYQRQCQGVPAHGDLEVSEERAGQKMRRLPTMAIQAR